MSVNGYTLSKHIMIDRKDRVDDILATGGFGAEVKKVPDEKTPGIFNVLTSTGVMMVVSEYCKICITLYKIGNIKKQRIFGVA